MIFYQKISIFKGTIKKKHKMKTQSIDTHIKAEKVQISLLREKTPAEKVAQVRSLSKSMIQLSKRAISRANEGMDDQQVNLLFIRLHYGPELAKKVEMRLGDKYDHA